MAPTNIYVPGVPSIGRNRRRVMGGSGGLTLPSGAIGLYFGGDLMSSPKAIPNRMATSVPNNLVPLPSRRYFDGFHWVVNATAANDGAIADPLGGTDATSLTTSSAQTWQMTTNPASVTLPAGQYTAGIWVRWRGTAGTSQNFWFGSSAAFGTGTATSSWQRFSKTFTSTGAATTIYPIRNPNAATQADFEIYGFSVYAGTQDLYQSDPGLVGHMMFGFGLGQNVVSTGAGSVKFNGANTGLIQLPTASAFTQLTILYIAKTSGSPTNAIFNSMFGQISGSGSSSFALGLRTLTSQFGLMYGSALVTPSQPTGEIYDPGNTFGSVGVSYDGTTGKLYSNGLLTGSAAVTKALSGLKDLLIGSMISGGVQMFSNYELGALAIFPRILSDAEVLQAHKYLKANCLTKGVPSIPDNRVLIYEGDSITYGTGAGNTQGYPYLAASQLTRGERGPNYAVFGSKFADMNSRLPTVTAMIDRAVADGRTPIVHFDIGSNDFVLGVSAATLYSQVKGYAATCRAHGAKVIAGTVLSRPEAGVDTLRNTYNPMLAAGVGTDFDGLSDFGTNALIGADGAWSNTTYFSGDQVHPTSAGYALMAPIAAAAVNALP